MNSIKSIAEPQRQALLGALQKICAIFWGPDEKRCEEMLNGNYFGSHNQLKSLLRFDPPHILDKLADFINSFQDSKALFDTLQEAYVRLFVSSKDGITAPLYQSCYEYENAPLMGPPALLMQAKFQNKGLSVSAQLNEPPDHLAIEIEYLYFLFQKGWADKEEGYIEEAVAFVNDVMLKWVDLFRQKLAEDQSAQFYFLTASILCAILNLVATKTVSLNQK
jgi:TorA-specific chaperone